MELVPGEEVGEEGSLCVGGGGCRYVQDDTIHIHTYMYIGYSDHTHLMSVPPQR